MSYLQIIDACMQAAIGSNGLTDRELTNLGDALRPGLASIRTSAAGGDMPFLALPAECRDLEAVRPIAERFRNEFDDVVVLGTGGSSLGGRALYAMADPQNRRGAPRLHIVTNVDPYSFHRLFDSLDPKRTCLVVISKSGGTAETLMQFLTVLPLFRDALGDTALKQRMVLITEPGERPLRRLADRFDLPVLDHDPKIGGRYSVLSVVGMLPAMIAGLEPIAVRAGAQAVLDRAFSARDPLDCPAALGAAIAIGLNRYRGVQGCVMLAYNDRLGSLSRWYRQLWAESLGKNGKGMTPIYAMGPVDQHSQLQLWLDGPNDKMFTVLGGPIAPGGAAITAEVAALSGLDYVRGRTLGDLMNASRQATAETLASHGRPVREMRPDEIDETSMGAMLMHFMLETILSAHLLGVDPFNQPAVEHGKTLTRDYMRALERDGEAGAGAGNDAA